MRTEDGVRSVIQWVNFVEFASAGVNENEVPKLTLPEEREVGSVGGSSESGLASLLGRLGLGSSWLSSSSRFVLGCVSLRLARPGGVDGVLS